MSGCPVEFAPDAVLSNPEITNGTAYGLHLVAPTITGGITLDAATVSALLKALGEDELGESVIINHADDIRKIAAGALSNCEGLPLIPDHKIATCADLACAIEASCCGAGTGTGTGAGGDTIKTLTFDDATRKLVLTVTRADGTSIQSWEVVIPEGGGSGGSGGDAITSMSFNATTRVLTVTTTYPDGSAANGTWSATIPGGSADFALGVKPDMVNSPALPVTRYGGSDMLLGTPDAWAHVIIDGKSFEIPLYNTPIAGA